MRKLWITRRDDLALGLLLAILPALFYPLAAVRQGVFYVGDIFRLYYPQRAVYADALRNLQLPLWTPDVFAGYPLLAEGQIGVFYPLNLLLYGLLPIDVALNYSILLALSLTGVAMYALGRVLCLRPAAASLAALAFTYGGFLIGHFNHLNIMAAAPWLPIELAVIERLVAITRGAPALASAGPRTRHVKAAVGLVTALGLTIGIQFLAGHPQISLMSILVALGFGLFRSFWPAGGVRRPVSSAVGTFGLVVMAVCIGLAVAAVQLLPTWELVGRSVRAGGLSTDFFASFSWHPGLLATLVVPFILGNPYPTISVELAAYVGLLPLCLAPVGLFERRDRLSAFLVALAGLSLVLAFGDYTPLYVSLARVPVLNLFRVPARFLYPFTLAVALLAGRGLDALLGRYDESGLRRSASEHSPGFDAAFGGLTEPTERRVDLRGLITVDLGRVLIVVGVIVAAVGIRAASLDILLALRWVLPAITLALSTGLLILAWHRRIRRHTVAWATIGLTLADLYAFGAVYRLTYNDLMPVREFYAGPSSLSFFPEDTQNYRVLTHEAIVPALSVARASLYPNISLLHGIPSAGGYFPLTPARHARYLATLTPGRLNLLNVQYFLIPQLLPVDPETERYDLHNPFTPDPIATRLDIPPTQADSVELVSFTSQSAGWPSGELVAEIVLTGRGGLTVTLPVRAGLETAEWAYDRPDVAEHVRHARPTVARTWPARSGFPPEDHPGHAYLARYRLPTPMEVRAVRVIPHKAVGLFHIEELTLAGQNQRHTMADLLRLGHHRLAYRDPDVVVYENVDALPRSFVVHCARLVPDDEVALSIIDSPDFDPRAAVLLAAGPTMCTSRSLSDARARIVSYSAHRIEIEATLDRAGYLVLLDSYYPGWEVTVDGRPASIQRADVLFRAVALQPGQHLVTFVYEPVSLKIGSAISLVGLAALTIAIAWQRRFDAS